MDPIDILQNIDKRESFEQQRISKQQRFPAGCSAKSFPFLYVPSRDSDVSKGSLYFVPLFQHWKLS